MAATLPLDFAGLRAWLVDHAEDTFDIEDTDECLLGSYLNELTPAAVVVNYSKVTIDGTVLALPARAVLLQLDLLATQEEWLGADILPVLDALPKQVDEKYLVEALAQRHAANEQRRIARSTMIAPPRHIHLVAVQRDAMPRSLGEVLGEDGLREGWISVGATRPPATVVSGVAERVPG